jgi:hypothetical protein
VCGIAENNGIKAVLGESFGSNLGTLYEGAGGIDGFDFAPFDFLGNFGADAMGAGDKHFPFYVRDIFDHRNAFFCQFAQHRLVMDDGSQCFYITPFGSHALDNIDGAPDTEAESDSFSPLDLHVFSLVFDYLF